VKGRTDNIEYISIESGTHGNFRTSMRKNDHTKCKFNEFILRLAWRDSESEIGMRASPTFERYPTHTGLGAGGGCLNIMRLSPPYGRSRVMMDLCVAQSVYWLGFAHRCQIKCIQDLEIEDSERVGCNKSLTYRRPHRSFCIWRFEV
jgi:hypothetical protein